MSENDPFILYLEENRDNRAMMASLRRGLGKAAGMVPEVSRIVQRRLGPDAPHWLETAYYLIAPLFALHPAEGGAGNIGNHFREMCPAGEDPPANVERRFIALSTSDPDDLDEVLRQAVTLLKSKDIQVNWQALLQDVLDWKHPDGERRTRVQKKWSRAFWRKPQLAAPAHSIPTTND